MEDHKKQVQQEVKQRTVNEGDKVNIGPASNEKRPSGKKEIGTLMSTSLRRTQKQVYTHNR